MRFGQIREILDHYTSCCKNCDEGTYEYCANENCNTFIAKLMREEILALVDEVEIEKSDIPKLSFKGKVTSLPEIASEGDTYLMEINLGNEKKQVVYYYHDGWKYMQEGIL